MPDTKNICTCPGDPSASAAGWDANCPVHPCGCPPDPMGFDCIHKESQAARVSALDGSTPEEHAGHGCSMDATKHPGLTTSPPFAPGGMFPPLGPFAPGGIITPPAPPTPDRIKRQRDAILETAASLISGDREDVYGSAIADFTRTGRMWAAVLGLEEVTAEQVALCMALVKVGRLCQTPGHFDSWVDACGYLALGGDIADEHARDDNTARQR